MADDLTPQEQEYFDWLKTFDGGSCTKIKKIRNTFYAAAKPLIYHWTMIIGEIGDKDEYLDRFCYETQQAVEKALEEWNGVGEPKGWHRNPRTGRRRPNGDVSKEYINF